MIDILKLFFVILVLYLIFLFGTLFGIGYVNVNNMASFRFSEECFFYFEKKIGLSDFYKKTMNLIDNQINNLLYEEELRDKLPDIYHVDLYCDPDKYCVLTIDGPGRNPYSLIRIIKPTIVQEYHEEKKHINWNKNIIFISEVDNFYNNFIKKETECSFEIYYIFIPILLYSLCVSSIIKNNGIKIILFLTPWILYYYFFTFPTLNFSNYNIECIHDVIQKVEIPSLNKYFQAGTRLVDTGDQNLIPSADLLCGNHDFFEKQFLCWNLKNYNYLYYFPEGFHHSMFFESIIKITELESHFYLVQYPLYFEIKKQIFHYRHQMLILVLMIQLSLLFVWKKFLDRKKTLPGTAL